MNYITVTATATEDAKIKPGRNVQAFECHVEVPPLKGKEDAYNTTTKLRVEVWGPNAVALVPKVTKGNRILIEGGELFLTFNKNTGTADNYIKGGQLRWIPPSTDINERGFPDVNSIFLTGRTNKHIAVTKEYIEEKSKENKSPMEGYIASEPTKGGDTTWPSFPKKSRNCAYLNLQIYTNTIERTANMYTITTKHWFNQTSKYAKSKPDPDWVWLLIAKFSKRHTPITVFGKLVTSPSTDDQGNTKEFIKIELAKKNGITLGADIKKDWVPRESQSVTREEPKSVPSPTMIDTQEVWGSIETKPTEDVPSLIPQTRTEIQESSPQEVPF